MKFDKPTLITITAPTCSGKSYLLEALLERGFGRIVSTTTRDPRAGERDGIDYNFLTVNQSKLIEEEAGFAELIEFRGVRYGVTHAEMAEKMASSMSPMVILEPQGLKAYEKYCLEKGWDIFKVFVSTPEQVRIQRLGHRTLGDIQSMHKKFKQQHLDWSGTVVSHASHIMIADADMLKVISTHTDRLLSITGDERLWLATNTWDAIVDGTDINKAIASIEQGIKWRNSQNAQVNT